MARRLGDTYGTVQLLGVMKFVKKEIIMDFSPPQNILSDNDLKFDCKAVQDFAHRFNIQWNCTSTYNPPGNGVAERMVGTLKKALQKVTQSESKEWTNLLRMYSTGAGVDPERT